MVAQEPFFAISNLHANATSESGEVFPILKGVNISVNPGEVHAIMGPNGSGKSTLATSILGNPELTISEGSIIFKGQDITRLSPDERGRMGLFLGFQYPEEISGLSVVQFLRQALSARRGTELSILELRVSMMEWMKKLGIESGLADRYLNEGFSGGEKKRNEILQMAILEPDLAILDETDSGLDIDALKTVGAGIREVRAGRPEVGVVIITHYRRLLDEVEPDRVHILVNGSIQASGGRELANELDRHGYEKWVVGSGE